MTFTRTEPLLSIEHVCLNLDGKAILRNVSAKVENLHRDDDGPNQKTGQTVAFLGPSGCGKTSLLRCIAGLQGPTAGRILVGKDQAPTRPGLVGMVAQNYPLFGRLTVLDNLKLASGQPGAAEAMLERFGLSAVADRYPVQISGGQRQRAAIAQQMLCSEHFLLMDEPTTGLDPNAKTKICHLISELANADDLNTLIVVTHDVRTALLVADTLWIMSNGEIVQTYDLAGKGLAYHPELCETPLFAEAEREILARFKTL